MNRKEKFLSLKVKHPASRKENTVWKIVFRKGTALLLQLLHGLRKNRKTFKGPNLNQSHVVFEFFTQELRDPPGENNILYLQARIFRGRSGKLKLHLLLEKYFQCPLRFRGRGREETFSFAKSNLLHLYLLLPNNYLIHVGNFF